MVAATIFIAYFSCWTFHYFDRICALYADAAIQRTALAMFDLKVYYVYILFEKGCFRAQRFGCGTAPRAFSWANKIKINRKSNNDDDPVALGKYILLINFRKTASMLTQCFVFSKWMRCAGIRARHGGSINSVSQNQEVRVFARPLYTHLNNTVSERISMQNAPEYIKTRVFAMIISSHMSQSVYLFAPHHSQAPLDAEHFSQSTKAYIRSAWIGWCDAVRDARHVHLLYCVDRAASHFNTILENAHTINNHRKSTPRKHMYYFQSLCRQMLFRVKRFFSTPIARNKSINKTHIHTHTQTKRQLYIYLRLVRPLRKQ